MLAGGVGLLVLAHSNPLLRWPYGDWQAVSAESRQALSLAGPWAAVCVAWIAARRSSLRGVAGAPVASRMGVEVVTAHSVVVCVVVLSSYLLALSPVFAQTALRATTGSANLLVVAGSVATLAAFASVGLLLGFVLGQRTAPLVAAIVTLGAVLAADALGPIAAPVLTVNVVAGQQENPTASAWRLLFMVMFSIACLYGAGLWLSLRTSPFSAITAIPALLLVPPIGLVFLSPSAAQDAVVYEANIPQTCSSTRPPLGQSGPRVEVCVHRARSPVLDDLVAKVQAVVDVAPVLSKNVTRVTDVNLWIPPRPGEITLQVQPQDAGWETFVVEDLAYEVSGSAACSVMSDGAEMTTDQTAAYDTSGGVAVWMIKKAGESPRSFLSGAPDAIRVAARLEDAGDARALQAIERVADSIARCTETDIQLQP